MYSLGVGATVSKADQTICVDPETEEEEGTATVAVGVLPALQKLSGVLLTGDVDVDEACQVGTWNHYN